MTVVSEVGGNVRLGRENVMPPAVADVASKAAVTAARAIRFMGLSLEVNLISK